MNLGDYLNTIAAKCGIAADDADLKLMLSNPTLSQINIPDGLSNKIDSSLLTVEAAKNNPIVLSAIKAQLYNGVDSEIEKALNDVGVEDVLKQELLAEKNTNKRISLALKKIHSLQEQKANAKGGDKAELQKEIDNLNNQIKDIKKSNDDTISLLKENHETSLLNYDLNQKLLGYNYAFPKEMPKEIALDTVRNLLNRNLQDKDGKFVRENGELKLLRKSTNGDYYDNNNKLTTKDFIESVLAQNKLLAVSNSNNDNNQSVIVTGEKTTALSTSWEDAINNAKSDFKAGT